MLKHLSPNELLFLFPDFQKWCDMFSVHFGVCYVSIPVCCHTNDLANLCSIKRSIYIVIYTDDIPLLGPSVGELHNLLASWQLEKRAQKDLIYTAISIKELCCMRIGY